MTSEELREELNKQLREELNKQMERETYDAVVDEYLRVKKLVADSGKLTHDECCAIAMECCKSRGTFDFGPLGRYSR